MDTSEWKILHSVNCDEIEKGGRLCFCCYPLKEKINVWKRWVEIRDGWEDDND